MAEPTLKEQENQSPYDLWPDATEAPDTVVPPAEPAVETTRLMGEMPFEAPFVPVVYTPESTEETVRNSGLAWSAGVVFFGSVAFMLFIGWLADLVLGTTPWGIVLGIILGAIIGFIQFFRISSRIYAPHKSSGPKSLMSDHHDD